MESQNLSANLAGRDLEVKPDGRRACAYGNPISRREMQRARREGDRSFLLSTAQCFFLANQTEDGCTSARATARSVLQGPAHPDTGPTCLIARRRTDVPAWTRLVESPPTRLPFFFFHKNFFHKNFFFISARARRRRPARLLPVPVCVAGGPRSSKALVQGNLLHVRVMAMHVLAWMPDATCPLRIVWLRIWRDGWLVPSKFDKVQNTWN
jgi:hypothetical protein